MKKSILSFILVLVSITTLAQCPNDFTLTATEADCGNNGTITITHDVACSVAQLNNVTIGLLDNIGNQITAQTYPNNTFGALSAGNYQVTITLNGGTASPAKPIAVISTYVDVSYTTSVVEPICNSQNTITQGAAMDSGTGQISVTPSNGKAPYTVNLYEYTGGVRGALIATQTVNNAGETTTFVGDGGALQIMGGAQYETEVIDACTNTFLQQPTIPQNTDNGVTNYGYRARVKLDSNDPNEPCGYRFFVAAATQHRDTDYFDVTVNVTVADGSVQTIRIIADALGPSDPANNIYTVSEAPSGLAPFNFISSNVQFYYGPFYSEAGAISMQVIDNVCGYDSTVNSTMAPGVSITTDNTVCGETTFTQNLGITNSQTTVNNAMCFPLDLVVTNFSTGAVVHTETINSLTPGQTIDEFINAGVAFAPQVTLPSGKFVMCLTIQIVVEIHIHEMQVLTMLQ